MHALFLVGSTRRDGNTEQLAQAAARSLPAGAAQTWLRLDEHPLPAFVDRRASSPMYDAPVGHARTLLDATLAASELVFVVPTYWYSLPAGAKLYLDHWSAWLRVPGVDFKARMAGKTLWLITVNSDEVGEDGSSEPLVKTLELTATYLKLRFGDALIGHGNRPGDVLHDVGALERAGRFFSR